jgi:hypothetical protein
MYSDAIWSEAIMYARAYGVEEAFEKTGVPHRTIKKWVKESGEYNVEREFINSKRDVETRLLDYMIVISKLLKTEKELEARIKELECTIENAALILGGEVPAS